MSDKNVTQMKKQEKSDLSNRFDDAFVSFQNRMNRMLDRFGDFADRERTFSPKVDVVETDGIVKVSAELPGMRQEDIDVSVKPESLILKGEKKEEREEEKEGVKTIERKYGSFYRQVSLPSEVDINSADATYSNGVLKITLHKSQSPGSRKIDLKPEEREGQQQGQQ